MLKIENLRNLPDPNSENRNHEIAKDQIDNHIHSILDPENQLNIDIDWSFWDNGELYIWVRTEDDPMNSYTGMNHDITYHFKIPITQVIVLQDHFKRGNNISANVFLTNYTF